MAKSMEDALDGELYLADSKPPAPPTYSSGQTQDADRAYGECIHYRFETDPKVEDVLFERVLAKWKDPTSPPHTREKCVKWCTVGPLKTCCGWKIQYRWLYRWAVLKVSTNKPVNIGAAVEKCLSQAAIAAAVASIVSGGGAAAAVASEMFRSCLMHELGDQIVSVAISLHDRRGDWE